jgi:hypothetical protein
MATRRKATTEFNALNAKDLISGSSNSNVNPIDEIEQDRVIKDLQLQCIAQTRQMATLLSYICFMAGAASLSSLFFHEYQGVSYTSFMYPLYVASLHALAGCIANDMANLTKKLNQESQCDNVAIDAQAILCTPPSFWSGTIVTRLGVVASFAPILSHVGIVRTTNVWVWILTGSNCYTFMAVIYMKKDSMKTFAQLFDLKDSTYKHKSL